MSNNNRQHRSPRSTPQMEVLGRDGRDFSRDHHESLLVERQRREEVAALPRRKEAAAAAAAAEQSGTSSWWSWKFSSKKESDNDDDDVVSVASYVSMGPTEDVESAPVKRAAPRKVSHDSTAPASKAAFMPVSTSETSLAGALTKEDVLQQDCSFFYQEADDQLQSPQHDSEFPSPVPDTPPRYRAAYRARFQQLNEVRRQDSSIDDDDNELWLHDEEMTTATPEIPRVSDVAHSSLCWSQNGRILMKLPKDKVRLLMDPHLEPGILSVEHTASSGRKTEDGENLNEIVYVLTVDDNLYRRVFADMSDAASSPCRLHHFCNDEGRLDISVAICLLSVVLVVLLVNTIIWPIG